MADVIDKGAVSDAHPTPLLFVHGAWHGAWCWDDHFLDFFASRGYRAVAVNLRGHGGRPTSKALRRLSLDDYIDDVAAAAAALPSPPVVIGHSLGGFITQRYLETHEAPAAVLVASVPPKGALPFITRWIRQRPIGFAKAFAKADTHLLLDTPEAVRRKFFSPTTSDAIVASCTERVQNESRQIAFDLSLRSAKPGRVSVAVLVLGADEDGCFPPSEVHSTAAAYRTNAVMFPMGHDMMLEPNWLDVAEHIDGWLVGQAL